jgi:hypothetical protein
VDRLNIATKKVQAIVHAMAIYFVPYVSMIRPKNAPPAHLQHPITSASELLGRIEAYMRKSCVVKIQEMAEAE